MSKRITTLSELRAQLENLDRERADLQAQLEGLSGLAQERGIIVELRDQLNKLALSESVDAMDALKKDIAAAKRRISQAAAGLNGKSERTGRTGKPRAAGELRFMAPFGKAFREKGNKPMTDAEIVGAQPVQTYMAAKGLSKGQVLQGIVDMANAGKLESVGQNKYRLPESRMTR